MALRDGVDSVWFDFDDFQSEAAKSAMKLSNWDRHVVGELGRDWHHECRVRDSLCSSFSLVEQSGHV